MSAIKWRETSAPFGCDQLISDCGNYKILEGPEGVAWSFKDGWTSGTPLHTRSDMMACAQAHRDTMLEIGNGKVAEPLRDIMGRALYEEPGCDLDWYDLSEERREPWRRDADRALKNMAAFGWLAIDITHPALAEIDSVIRRICANPDNRSLCADHDTEHSHSANVTARSPAATPHREPRPMNATEQKRTASKAEIEAAASVEASRFRRKSNRSYR